jgi:hypothetical protein
MTTGTPETADRAGKVRLWIELEALETFVTGGPFKEWDELKLLSHVDTDIVTAYSINDGVGAQDLWSELWPEPEDAVRAEHAAGSAAYEVASVESALLAAEMWERAAEVGADVASELRRHVRELLRAAGAVVAEVA